MSHFLQPHGLYPTRFPCSWDFPGKNTGVSCHFLLQVIVLIQGLKLCLFCLLHCHWQASSLPIAPPGKCLLQSSNNRHSNWNLQYFLIKKKKRRRKKENISKWIPWAPCNSSGSASHFNLLEVISVHRIKAKAHQGWNILIPNEALVSFTWGWSDC